MVAFLYHFINRLCCSRTATSASVSPNLQVSLQQRFQDFHHAKKIPPLAEREKKQIKAYKQQLMSFSDRDEHMGRHKTTISAFQSANVIEKQEKRLKRPKEISPRLRRSLIKHTVVFTAVSSSHKKNSKSRVQEGRFGIVWGAVLQREKIDMVCITEKSHSKYYTQVLETAWFLVVDFQLFNEWVLHEENAEVQTPQIRLIFQEYMTPTLLNGQPNPLI